MRREVVPTTSGTAATHGAAASCTASVVEKAQGAIALHSCGSASNTNILGDPVVNDETNTTIYPLVPGTLAAGGGRGVHFLRRLAASCDVPVRGGIHSQLNDRRYRFPVYWAPFLMIGNWL